MPQNRHTAKSSRGKRPNFPYEGRAADLRFFKKFPECECRLRAAYPDEYQAFGIDQEALARMGGTLNAFVILTDQMRGRPYRAFLIWCDDFTPEDVSPYETQQLLAELRHKKMPMATLDGQVFGRPEPVPA